MDMFDRAIKTRLGCDFPLCFPHVLKASLGSVLQSYPEDNMKRKFHDNPRLL